MYDTVYKRLRLATPVELEEICKALKIPNTNNIEEISKKYRAAAGHSVVNLFRRTDIIKRKLPTPVLPYKRILIDVADKLKSGFAWTEFKMNDGLSEEYVEEKILEYCNKRVEEEFNRLSEEKRKDVARQIDDKLKSLGYSQTVIKTITSAIISGTFITVLTTPVTLSIFYSGIMASFWAGIFGPSTFYLALSGTGIGIAITIPLLVGTFGGPAYRKTIPATIQMIMIRKRIEAEKIL